MWIEPPKVTQAQRDKGNEMAARILKKKRLERAMKEHAKKMANGPIEVWGWGDRK